jgi:hypothetical protein
MSRFCVSVDAPRVSQRSADIFKDIRLARRFAKRSHVGAIERAEGNQSVDKVERLDLALKVKPAVF